MREIEFRAWDIKAQRMRKVVSMSSGVDINGTRGWFCVLQFVRKVTPQDQFGGHPEVSGICEQYKSKISNHILMQYTGFKDKNGVEIFELMELNEKYLVIYEAPKYVLKDISNGDIIDIWKGGDYEITREYKKI